MTDSAGPTGRTPTRPAGEPARRRLAPEERKREIVLAARRLMSKDPNVSLDEIAREAGVTRQLVSIYFPGGGTGPIVAAMVEEFRDRLIGFIDLSGLLNDVVDFDDEEQFRKAITQVMERLLDMIDEVGEAWMFSLSRDIPGSGFGASTENAHRLIVDGILAARTLPPEPLTVAMYRSELMAIDSLVYSYTKSEISRDDCLRALVERLAVLRFVTIPALSS